MLQHVLTWYINYCTDNPIATSVNIQTVLNKESIGPNLMHNGHWIQGDHDEACRDTVGDGSKIKVQDP